MYILVYNFNAVCNNRVANWRVNEWSAVVVVELQGQDGAQATGEFYLLLFHVLKTADTQEIVWKLATISPSHSTA